MSLYVAVTCTQTLEIHLMSTCQPRCHGTWIYVYVPGGWGTFEKSSIRPSMVVYAWRSQDRWITELRLTWTAQCPVIFFFTKSLFCFCFCFYKKDESSLRIPRKALLRDGAEGSGWKAASFKVWHPDGCAFQLPPSHKGHRCV